MSSPPLPTDMTQPEDVAVQTLLNLQSTALKVETAVAVLQHNHDELKKELVDLRNLIIADGNGLPAQIAGLKNSVDALRKEVHASEVHRENLKKRVDILESYESHRQIQKDKWGEFVRSSMAGVVPLLLTGTIVIVGLGFQAYLYLWHQIPIERRQGSGKG